MVVAAIAYCSRDKRREARDEGLVQPGLVLSPTSAKAAAIGFFGRVDVLARAAASALKDDGVPEGGAAPRVAPRKASRRGDVEGELWDGDGGWGDRGGYEPPAQPAGKAGKARGLELQQAWAGVRRSDVDPGDFEMGGQESTRRGSGPAPEPGGWAGGDVGTGAADTARDAAARGKAVAGKPKRAPRIPSPPRRGKADAQAGGRRT